jgi:hypothetical protein
MPRGKSTFTQSDVSRAVKGVLKSGASVRRIDFNGEGFKLILTPSSAPISPSPDANEWDEVLDDDDDAH